MKEILSIAVTVVFIIMVFAENVSVNIAQRVTGAAPSVGWVLTK